MLRRIVDYVHGNCFGITIPDVAWVGGQFGLRGVCSGSGGFWIIFNMLYYGSGRLYAVWLKSGISWIIFSMLLFRWIVDNVQYALGQVDCGLLQYDM